VLGNSLSSQAFIKDNYRKFWIAAGSPNLANDYIKPLEQLVEHLGEQDHIRQLSEEFLQYKE
jgi:hypothetical protein